MCRFSGLGVEPWRCPAWTCWQEWNPLGSSLGLGKRSLEEAQAKSSQLGCPQFPFASGISRTWASQISLRPVLKTSLPHPDWTHLLVRKPKSEVSSCSAPDLSLCCLICSQGVSQHPREVCAQPSAGVCVCVAGTISSWWPCSSLSVW